MPSDELIQAQRDALLADETASAQSLTAAFQTAYDAIVRELDSLTVQMEQTAARGEPVNQAWLLRQRRLASLEQQAAQALGQFAAVSGEAITERQRAAAGRAQVDAAALINVERPMVSTGWNRLPVDALEDLAGHLGDGTPLRLRLKVYGVQAVQSIRQELISGLALGRNPRVIASRVKKVAGVPLPAALTIARTETLRAYRESTLRAYAANPDVIVAWRWVASLSVRTCPACIALHGQIFRTSDSFGTHPNCRCTSIPVLKGQEGASFETGEEWIRRQPEGIQNAIVGGIAVGNALRIGRIKISDFVEENTDPRWGLTRRAKSAHEVMEPWSADARGSSGSASGSGKPAKSKAKKSTALGTPISQNLIVLKDPQDFAVHEGLKAIDSVHGAGSLAPMEVVWDPTIPGHARFRLRADRQRYEIVVRPRSLHYDIRVSVVHEVGHLLDALALDLTSPGWPSAISPLLQQWRDAVYASTAYKKLVDLRTQLSDPKVDQKMVEYLLKDHELFARSYAQWITLRSQNADMQLWHETERGLPIPYATVWHDDDFLPIAEALDQLFRGKSWMR